MANQNIFGTVRSVKIFDNNKKGEIILRTTTGEITLKLSDDNDSAFSGMAAVASAAVEFGNIVTLNVNVKYDDDDMEIDEITLIQSNEACIPVSPNSKPKQTLQFKLERLLRDTSKPSVMAADFFHMVRRFLADKTAGNSHEVTLFNIFQHLSPETKEILKCTLQKFDSLSPVNRDPLLNSDFLGDINLANDPVKIRDAIAQEALHYVILKNSDNKCAGEPRPGLVRTQQNPGGEFPPLQVLICTINGLSIGPTQNEIEFGSDVVLEGMNFSSIDTKVQFTDSTSNTRLIDTFVCGDEETPLTENINGVDVPIIDCRVHDRLSFRLPVDMLPGQYFLQVLVPNPNLVGGFADPLFSDSVTITIVVPSSARFEIASETLHCKDETHADFLGSDEVGIRIAAIPLFPDRTTDDIQWTPSGNVPIEFGNVDSGNTRTMDFLLFSQQQPMIGVGILIRGWEIDGRDQIIDVSEAFTRLVILTANQARLAFNQAETECTLGANPNEGNVYVEWRTQSESGLGPIGVLLALVFIIWGIVKLIDAIHGAWAPADPIIADDILLTTSDLLQLTSTDFPLPSPSEYDVNGIKVKVTPIEKSNNQYREKREYISDDEGGKYEIVLRYNRVA